MPARKTSEKKKAKRIGGPTLKERQASGGSQAARRRAQMEALREKSGPRKGLTKAVGAHGGSVRNAAATAETLTEARRRKKASGR